MNVALVHDYLNQSGGAERVLKALCELFPEAPIFTLLYDEKKTGGEFAAKTIRASFLQRIPGARHFHRALAPLMPLAIEQLDLHAYDLIVSNSESFAKGVLKRPDALHICYCHTPARFLWEGHQKHLTRSRLPFFCKAIAPPFLTYLRVWDLFASRNVDVFLANSRFIAARIQKYYRRDAEVIYPPVAMKDFDTLYQKKNYYLLLMRLVPYKRPEIVVEAFNEIGLPLIVVGDGPMRRKLVSMAKPNVTFLGAKPHSKVARYYGEAQALLFPQEEDFGVSALEACASGTPVIAFRAGGAREIVREGVNGMFFESQTARDVVKAVRAFQKNRFDAKIIRKSMEGFDEERFKREMMGVLKNLISNFQESNFQTKLPPQY